MRFFTTVTPAGRLEYFLVALVLNAALLFVIVSVLGLTAEFPIVNVETGERASTPTFNYQAEALATVLAASLFATVLAAINCLRRMKDLHMGAAWIICLFIPIVGWLFQLQLLFSKGISRNTYAPYGDDPYDPNSWVEDPSLDSGSPTVTFRGQALLLPGEDRWDDQAA